MTINEISAAAVDYFRIPDENVNVADRAAWYALRSLYEDFRRKVITAEAGKDMKRQIVAQHMRDTGQLRLCTDALSRSEDQLKRAERAAISYAKSDNRTPEADALFEVFYGRVLEARP